MVKKKAKKIQKKKTVKKTLKKKVFKKISHKKVFKAKAKKCKLCKPAKKKVVKQKLVQKKVLKKIEVRQAPPGILVGEVVHFYPNISVAVVEIKKNLKKGDKISFFGKDISFTQTVESMQIDYKNIDLAKKGDAIGMKTAMPVKEKIKVYKVDKN